MSERNEPKTDNRNERRPDRNRHPSEGGRSDMPSQGEAGTVERTVLPVAVVTEPSQELAQGANDAVTRPEGAETRERRPRGRDRAPRERGEQVERQDRPVRETQPVSEPVAEEPRRSYFTTSQDTAAPAPVAVQEVPAVVVQAPEAAPVPVVVAKPVPAPVTVVTPVAPAPAVAPVPTEIVTGMPKVHPFVLPLGELAQVAQTSGLSWVNSDATKIAAVQAGIAAEPKAVHVPRMRPAVTHAQAGPLVLVETKRDLNNMTLPFEENGVK